MLSEDEYDFNNEDCEEDDPTLLRAPHDTFIQNDTKSNLAQ